MYVAIPRRHALCEAGYRNHLRETVSTCQICHAFDKALQFQTGPIASNIGSCIAHVGARICGLKTRPDCQDVISAVRQGVAPNLLCARTLPGGRRLRDDETGHEPIRIISDRKVEGAAQVDALE